MDEKDKKWETSSMSSVIMSVTFSEIEKKRKEIAYIEAQTGNRQILVSWCCGGIIHEEKELCPVCHKKCEAISEEEYENDCL